jgi:hypothetical protein
MAVVATMLAGLASSEMTRAQYDRSLGAQQQSKAGDQWSFFQAKRLRGAIQRNTADLLQATTEIHPVNATALKEAIRQAPVRENSLEVEPVKKQLLALLESAPGQQALAALQSLEPPKNSSSRAWDPNITAAMEGVESSTPDAELAMLVNKVDSKSLDAALRSARDQAQQFDTQTKPVNQALDQFDSLLGRWVTLQQNSSNGPNGNVSSPAVSLTRDFTAARLHYAALRYEVEARLNQTIANLFEVQVRKSNISAEHHHRRSQRFFFGMLGAQTGVIISTLAMAAKNRNLLWSIAAVAGLVAVAFAVYVYLYV